MRSDGILILDTGGWYKLCCPSSQLVKPDVKGAIYRVKKVGAHKERLKRKVEPLPSLYTIALNRDVSGIDFAISSLKDPNLHIRRVAAEALGRIRIVRAVPYLIEALADERNDATLDHALTFALIQLEDRDSLKKMIPDTTFKVRRALLTALDQIPAWSKADSDNIFEFFAKGEKTIDMSIQDETRRPFIRSHFAKMGMPRPADNEKYTKEQFAVAHSKGLAALGSLDSKHVLAELNSPDAALRETAWWIAGRHPEWGTHLADYFQEQLNGIEKLKPVEREELTERLAKFAKNEAIQKVVGEAAVSYYPEGRDPTLLRVMARSGVKTVPKPWLGGLTRALISKDNATVKEAFAAIRSLPVAVAEYDEIIATALKIRERGFSPPWSDEQRLTSYASAPANSFALNNEQAAFLLQHLGSEQAATRSLAIDGFLRAKPSAEQFPNISAKLKSLSPLDQQKLIPIFAKSTDEKVGLALVVVLSDPKLLPSIRTETIKPILDKYPPAVRDAADALYAKLAEARKGETAKLERLVKELPTGDIRRGQAVFNGAKAQCAACHKIGYVGGLIGPDLTKIGGIRTERDLLEAIVFPSASFVRSYEPVRVTTLDGRVLSGILKKDAPDEIVLTIAADKEERLARADVESIAPGTVSVMPDGFDKQVTPQELADLVAFLKACK